MKVARSEHLLLDPSPDSVGEKNPDAIAHRAAELRHQRRLFTFGIGADVNAELLEQLALQGRGTATFVRPEESVERAVGIVTERLTRPVATDVQLRVDGVRLYSVQPQGAIDIFAGQDLVVLARYSGARENTTITIEGRTPDGPVRWTGRASLPARLPDNGFVARLWAVQRVGFLSAERHRSGGNSELDAELRQLGERYGIPTELTSYLVVEPGMKVADQLQRKSRDAQGGGLALSPVAVTAVAGFEAAKAASEQRASTNLGAFNQSNRSEGKETMRTAGSHTFVLINGVWTDTRRDEQLRVVRVKAYSAAYFALVQRVPELGPLFSVGERTRVHGRRVAIEVADDGMSHLDPMALDAVAKDW